MELLDKEMDQSEDVGPYWKPENQEDYNKQEMSNQYIDLNRKLRAKIGDLLEGLDNVIRRTQERRETINQKPIYGGGIIRSNSYDGDNTND